MWSNIIAPCPENMLYKRRLLWWNESTELFITGKLQYMHIKTQYTKICIKPSILKSEVSTAMVRIRRDKSAGSNEVVIEMVLILDNIGIDKIIEVINENGKILED